MSSAHSGTYQKNEAKEHSAHSEPEQLPPAYKLWKIQSRLFKLQLKLNRCRKQGLIENTLTTA